MAWMITAGNWTSGGACLSIASNDTTQACGWRFKSGNGQLPHRDVHLRTPGAARVWQDVLAQLTAE